MKKWLSTALIMLLAMMTLPAAYAEETVLFTDSAGRTVEVSAEITRIAPSGSLAQIFLFALAPDHFVGLSTEWPKDAKQYIGTYADLPVIGALYGTADLNLEELAAMDPQVIIDVGETKGAIAEDMDTLQEQVGIPAVHIGAHIGNYADAYRMLGVLLSLEDRAEALAVYCETAMDRTHQVLEKVEESGKKDLLYCLGTDGLSVIAKGSYHAEIIDLIADNLAVVENFSSKGSGDSVDMEQLLLWDPEFIVFAPDSAYGEVGEDPLWQELTAIRNGNYVQVPFGPYNWVGSPPSVQRYLSMLWLCDLLYPEAVDYQLQDEITEYFRLFYHCELTQAQYDALMDGALIQKGP